MSLAVTQTLTVQGVTVNLLILSKNLCRQCFVEKKLSFLAISQTFNDPSVRYFHWHSYLLLTRFILYVPLVLLGPQPPY